MSVDELASKSKIRKEYIKKIEEGVAYGVSTIHLFMISNALSVNPSVLQEGVE